MREIEIVNIFGKVLITLHDVSDNNSSMINEGGLPIYGVRDGTLRSEVFTALTLHVTNTRASAIATGLR